MNCRHCAAPLSIVMVDLGSSPASNAYLGESDLHAPEKWYPLRVLVCDRCWLVQTEDFARADELFDAKYAYFSGFSASWIAHCERYAGDMVSRFGLDACSHVVEVATNDGTLLQFFQTCGIPCTGIEPTASTAAAARRKGMAVVEEFFGTGLARQLAGKGRQADLIAANNVLAHVPDINDFIAGFAILLKPQGVATFEFPHLVRLVEETQFDTIYHEHFSYLSLGTVERIFVASGLSIFDVEELSTHGGSLRVYAQRKDSGQQLRSARVDALLAKEASRGVFEAAWYSGFQNRTNTIKDSFLAFLLDAKRQGKTVVGYGAAAKGNTLLNYAGVRKDLIAYVVDRNPAKQGKYLPGSRIPILGEERLKETLPDYIVVLPWNLRNEVMSQLGYARDWGARFVTCVPGLEVSP